MFNGDPRRMSTEEAVRVLGAAGWLVKPAYERLMVSRGEQERQLAYSTPTTIAVYTQDVQSLLACDAPQESAILVRLTAVQSAELFAQYHEDTPILKELAIKVVGREIEGRPDSLRELAKLIAMDYDLETGFETVSGPLKRAMLRAAEHIVRQVSA